MNNIREVYYFLVGSQEQNTAHNDAISALAKTAITLCDLLKNRR